MVEPRGAMLISVSETETSEILAESKIKQMAGNDRVKARHL